MTKYPLLFSLLAVLPLCGQTTLTLAECVNAARTQSAQVRQATQQLQAAKAQKSAARTHWFPTVAAQATAFKSADYLVNIDNAGGNLPVYDGDVAHLAAASQFAYMPPSSMGLLDQMGVAMLTVVQPVYAGGRVQTGNQLADLGVDVARLQSSKTEKEVVIATLDRYHGLVALQATRATLKAQVDLMDTLERDVRQAYAAGFATSRDTLELAIHRRTVGKYLQDLDDGIMLAGQDLCRSLGNYCTGAVRLADTLGPLEEPLQLHMSHEATLERRDESRLLDKSVLAETLQGELDQGELRPQVLVGAALMGMSDFENTPTHNAFLFANVTVPLSGFWEGNYRAQANKAKTEKAEVEAREVKSLLLLEMDKSWNELNANWRALELARFRQEKEVQAFADARDRFAQGMDKAADLVSAQVKLQTAAESEIQARRAYLHSRAYYLKATGRAPDQG